MAADSSSFSFLAKSIPQWLQKLDDARNSIAIQYLETPSSTWDEVEDVHATAAVPAKSATSPGNVTRALQNQQTTPLPALLNTKHHASQPRQHTLPAEPAMNPGEDFQPQNQQNRLSPAPLNTKHHEPELRRNTLPAESATNPGNAFQAEKRQSIPPPALPNARYQYLLRQLKLPEKYTTNGNAFAAQKRRSMILQSITRPTVVDANHPAFRLPQRTEMSPELPPTSPQPSTQTLANPNTATRAQDQPNIPSPPLSDLEHHESQQQQPSPKSPDHRPTSPKSSKRKRSSLAIASPEQSAPAKPCLRIKREVYYNGEAQRTLHHLTDAVSTEIHALEKGKRTAHLISAQPFNDAGRALEKAQSAIEEAAWENLRNGECDAEMMKVKESLENALGVARAEVAREEKRRREREAVVKERTLSPRLSHVTLVQHTGGPPTVTYTATTAIEVDDEEEEEDDGKDDGTAEMLRFRVRRAARVSAR